MTFKTNLWLEEYEKKHPIAFFVISLIICILLISVGLCLSFSSIGDKSVSILMIVIGTLGVICTILLKLCSLRGD